MSGRLIHADVLDGLREINSDSVDLICTSPPYAEQRTRQYGGIPPDEYAAWYAPIAQELARVLRRPSGSYILNVKESLINGQRSFWVYDTVRAHVEQAGLRWHDTLIWRKTNGYPAGAQRHRLRDAWEHLYHFTHSNKPYLAREAVARPVSASTIAHRKFRSQQIDVRIHHHSGYSGNRKRMSDVEIVYPDNVLEIGVGGHNAESLEWHPARFPLSLPAWLIRAMCPPGGLVLDPFMGSGTTAVAAEDAGRPWVGIERSAEYVRRATRRIEGARRRRLGKSNAPAAGQERLTAPAGPPPPAPPLSRLSRLTAAKSQ